MISPVFLSSLLSCATPASPVDSADTAAESCGVTIDETWPLDGSSDAYWRGAIEFSLNSPDGSAWVVADFSGTQWTEDGGRRVLYEPAPPLEPLTQYTVGLDYCSGRPEIGFRTSELGLPVEDPTDLIGRTYRVDLAGGRFTRGGAIGEGLSSFFPRSVLFQITDLGAEGMSMRAALSEAGDPGTQDLCTATVDIEGVDSSQSPWFQFALDDFVFGAWEGELALLDFTLEGTVAPDASYAGGLAWSAAVPVSQLGAIFGYDDVGEVCAEIEARGVPCEICPDYSDSACVYFGADRIEAEAIGIDLLAIEEPGCP